MNLDRLESLVGLNNLVKIKNLRVLIIGIGGVGGYTFESLVRCGVNNISIVDGDVIDVTNLNRQIVTTQDNIGKFKIEEAYKRAKSINKNINLSAYKMFLDEDNINNFDLASYDYVVDACDQVSVKALIMERCVLENVKIISSMGTAKKMDASKLIITSLDKTSYDPLAKKMRKMIDAENQKKIIVVSSNEEVKDMSELGSNSFVPGVAGLLITNYIINDIL